MVFLRTIEVPCWCRFHLMEANSLGGLSTSVDSETKLDLNPHQVVIVFFLKLLVQESKL